MALFRGGTQLGPDASGGHERRSRPHLCVARSQPGAAALAEPQRRFHLSKLNHEVSEALRGHKKIKHWGGASEGFGATQERAPSFQEVNRCRRECEHSSGVAVLSGAALSSPGLACPQSPEGLRPSPGWWGSDCWRGLWIKATALWGAFRRGDYEF